MQQDVVTVGVYLAKSVFQVHAIDADGKVLLRRQLRRSEVLKFFSGLAPCLVGMEACASAHHWGRADRARARRASHSTGLCEAVREAREDRGCRCRGDLRSGDPADRAVCGGEDARPAAVLMLHKTRDLLVRQRTGLMKALRAHLAEYGIISSKGRPASLPL